VGDIGSMMRAITREAPPLPRSFNPSLPAALEELIMKLLEKDRGMRIATAHELSEQLYGLLPGGSANNDKVLAAFVASVEGVADAPGSAVPGRPAVVGGFDGASDDVDATEPMPPALLAFDRRNANADGRLNDDTQANDTSEVAPITLAVASEVVVDSAAPATISTTRSHAVVDDASKTVRIPHRPPSDEASRAYVALGVAIALAIGAIGVLVVAALR
jgi:hypothetical protein